MGGCRQSDKTVVDGRRDVWRLFGRGYTGVEVYQERTIISMNTLTTFAAGGPHISVAPDVLFQVGPIAVTNSFLLGLFGYGLIVGGFFAVARLARERSRSKFMHAVMWVYELLLDTSEQVLGSRERAKQLAPIAVTMFIAILVNNWLGLLPIVGALTYNGMPLFRGLAADLNATLALAVISMVLVQVWAIKSHGFFGNIGRYLKNPLQDPFGAFEGFLEIIAEFSRLVALSMRLFGNVLGGEVLLAVIGFISSFGSPLVLPVFMGLELFVGAVQAYVFFMLTIVFISIGSAQHDTHHPATKSVAVSSGASDS